MNNKQNHMKGRQRGRNGGGGKPRPPGRNPNFDGNNRPRGNAQQLMEKYLALARDASSAGDRVLAENYFQHADHYYRVLNARFEQQNGGRRFEGQGQGQDRQQYDRQGYGNERPYEADQQPQHGPGSYQAQQPPVQHQTATQGAAEPQQGNDSEIALPPGILGEAPLDAPAAEPQQQEAGEVQQGGDFSRGRHSGRRRRGRGDRSFANAGPAGE